jgi:hypothetical protein
MVERRFDHHGFYRQKRVAANRSAGNMMSWELGAGVLVILGTVLVTLASYFFMRFITGGDPEGRDRPLADSIIFRISALHGLILALVFAQEMIEYQQLKYQSTTEANAVADIYFDAGRYGGDSKAAIQQAMAGYVETVISKEWDQLGATGQLSSQAWGQWDAAYLAVLDLTPTNGRETSLRQHMLDKLQVISETRDRRQNTGASSVTAIFWFAALSGVVFIAMAYYTYAPTPTHVVLISLYGAFTGIILFFIYAFSNPYAPPAELSPAAFERLRDEIATGREEG